VSVNEHSLRVTRLEPFWHDVPLPKATGFFYKFGQTHGLVTNWHVLTGRHAVTENLTDEHGRFPMRLKCHWTEQDQTRGAARFLELELPVIKDGQPTWWQHRGFRNQEGTAQQVDIGVICLNDWMPNYEKQKSLIAAFDAAVLVQMDEQGNALHIEYAYAKVGAEVFILGFPMGLALQGVLPIWKRGSIASEPLVAIDGNLPIFFVDAATRHGMSGSPVVYFGSELTDPRGAPAHAPPTFPSPWLLGVYAGRRGSSPEEGEMSLGRVWHRRLLDEIFFARVKGGSPALADEGHTVATPDD
jgi:hypothetical protein